MTTNEQADIPQGWDAVVVSVNFIRDVEGGSDQQVLEENALRYWAVSQDRTDEINGRASTQMPAVLIALGKGESGRANEVLDVFQLTRARRGEHGVEFERAATLLSTVTDLRQRLIGKELVMGDEPVSRPQGVKYLGEWPR